MKVGEVTVINVPTIKDGGSKKCDLDLIKNVYEKGTNNNGIIFMHKKSENNGICSHMDGSRLLY